MDGFNTCLCTHEANRHICPSDLETLRCLIISYQKVSLNHHLTPKNTFPRLLKLLLNIPTLLRALKDKHFIHQLLLIYLLATCRK